MQITFNITAARNCSLQQFCEFLVISDAQVAEKHGNFKFLPRALEKERAKLFLLATLTCNKCFLWRIHQNSRSCLKAEIFSYEYIKVWEELSSKTPRDYKILYCFHIVHRSVYYFKILRNALGMPFLPTALFSASDSKTC